MPSLCACTAVIEGEARSFSLGRRSFIVVRREDQYHVYLNQCPHQGIPLEWHPDSLLDEEGELLRCATHGALFEIETGYCVAGPCSGDHLIRMDFTLRDGFIWLDEAAEG